MPEQLVFCTDIVPKEIDEQDYDYINISKQDYVFPNIISIVSPKGGVGKSTLAKELAATFSQMFFENRRINVCLVDGNIDNSNIDIILGLEHDVDMLDWAYDIQKVISDRALWYKDIVYTKEQMDTYLKDYTSNLKVLMAPKYAGYDKEITTEVINVMINNIYNYGFDIIIFDTGRCYSNITLELVKKSFITLAIGTDELVTIKKIKEMYDYYYSYGYDIDKVNLVINQVHNNKNKDKFNRTDICNYIGISDIYFEIEYEKNMIDVNNKKECAVLGNLKRFSKNMEELAIKISPNIYYDKKLIKLDRKRKQKYLNYM